MKQQYSIRLCLFGILVAVFLPSFVLQGMFLDGLTHSAIANNLSNGVGSFWNPSYTQTLHADYHEHPPLVFILQSYFFTWFGDGFLTDRLYCGCILIVSLVGIASLWSFMVEEKKLKSYYWLPILLCLLVPIFSWSYPNHLLECTLSAFCMFASLCFLKGIKQQHLGYVVLGSFLTCFAFLSKGLVGLFPLAVIPLYGLIIEKKQALVYTLCSLLSITIIGFISLSLWPAIGDNLVAYFNQQLIPALQNKREVTVGNRFILLWNLLVELAVPLGVLLIGSFLFYKKQGSLAFDPKRVLFFICIGLAASLPIMISLKQRTFYLLPSIPYFALAISFLLVKSLDTWMEKLPAKFYKLVGVIGSLCLMAAFAYSVSTFKDYGRDADLISDVESLKKEVPPGTTISSMDHLCRHWSLVAYLIREANISLDCKQEHDYLLAAKGSISKPADDYTLLETEMQSFVLYVLK